VRKTCAAHPTSPPRSLQPLPPCTNLAETASRHPSIPNKSLVGQGGAGGGAGWSEPRVSEIKLYFIGSSRGNAPQPAVHSTCFHALQPHFSTRASPGESTTLEIHTLSMAPRKFYHPQALKRCALEPHAATFTLRHPPLPFYHPQALKLCAREIQAIRIATLKLSSCMLSSSRPSHCYL
jgi:hypothetical protein